jgi:ribosome biogenesis SPOUT family RNA methylase Rps3
MASLRKVAPATEKPALMVKNMSPAAENPLLRVCALLNKHGARYLIVGGHACILHGLVRTTEDVDLLIEESLDNYRRVIAALSELPDGAAAELKPEDIEAAMVIKVADEVIVDISRRARTVSYAGAITATFVTDIDSVKIPCIGLKDLIASKKTCREKDAADLILLRRLARP